MIVSLEYVWRQSTGSIIMAEVDTEEEAFAEMRRFLHINNIPSDTTSVEIVEEQEYIGEIIPRHKEVCMRQSGYTPPKCREFPDPCFGIYYGTDKPRRGSLKKDFNEYGLTMKKDYYGKTVTDDNGHPVLVSDYYENGNKWYTLLLAYILDFEKRKAGKE